MGDMWKLTRQYLEQDFDPSDHYICTNEWVDGSKTLFKVTKCYEWSYRPYRHISFDELERIGGYSFLGLVIILLFWWIIS